MRGGLTRRAPFARLAVCCVLAALPTAGCGSGGGSTSSADEPPAPRATTRTLSTAEQKRADRARLAQLERDFVPNPYPEPPATRPHRGRIRHLAIREVVRGRGPALRGDENVYANFVKTYWKSGRKFNVRWGRLRFEYVSLSNEAIGIRRGMIGMRPGGRRVILMPRAVSEAHEPNGGAGFVDARVDIVLRQIIPTG